MADRNVNQIVVQLIDKLTAPARTVERSIKGIQQAAKGSQLDLVGFNRALFATTAFVGTVSRAFSGMFSAIEKGAELGRLSDQFERVLGPQGHFFAIISQFTDTSVDRIEALRSGIELANLGISRNAEVTAAMIAKASVAAKRGGFDAATGIKEYTAFLKDGSIAHLENIGLINRANMSYMVQQKILESSGGTMGGVIALQARYSIGQMLLNQRTAGLMHGHRDLVDVLQRLGNTFVDLRRNIGQFLGTALTPVLDKITDMASRFSTFLEHLRKNHKGVLELAKSFIVATAAMASFLLTAVVIKNVIAGITALGFGLGGFFKIFLGVALADKLVNLTNLLALLSRFVQDITQQLILVASPISHFISWIERGVTWVANLVSGNKAVVSSWDVLYKTVVKLTAAIIIYSGALRMLNIMQRATAATTMGAVGSAALGATAERDALGVAYESQAAAGGRTAALLASMSKFATKSRIGKTGLMLGAFGALETAGTAMDKKASTKDVVTSILADTVAPILGGIIGSFTPVGPVGGALIGTGLGQLGKVLVGQTDRTVDAINGVKDELSDDQTDNALPKIPDTQLELIGRIADMMGGIRGEQQSVFSEAFRAAVLPMSEGGKDVTAQEYVKLQKIANGFLKDIRDQKAAANSGSRKFKNTELWGWH